MICLAEAHLSLLPTGAGLMILVALGVWYWRQLSRGSVPAFRRRLRRIGLVIGGAVAVSGCLALSVFDPQDQPLAYLAAWGTVAVLLVPAVAVAVVDVIFTIQMHQRSLDRRLARDALRIRREIIESDDASRNPESE